MNDERLSHWFSSSKDVSSRLAETIEILDDITRLTSDWVWSLDDELNINFISDRIFDSCGIPAEEVLGTRLTELGSFTKSPTKSHQPDFHKPFRDVPFQVITRVETTRNLLISGLPVFSFETGQFTGVRGIARDITDQIQAETSSNRLHLAIDEISEVFILCDKNDEIITANRSARSVNGAFVDKLAPGTPFSEFVTSIAESGLVSDARGREQAWIAERLEFHRNPGRPFEVRREDGTHYLIHEDRLPDGSTATFSVDITERKQMERSLQEIVKRQHEFATDVAHELRTPMAVLRANLDSLPDSEIVKSLKTDVDAVSRMVEELVAESRFEELEIVTDERADLLAIAKAVATYVAPLAIRHDRLIEVTGVDSPTMVWGRTEALEQAVHNLAENAIKHSDKGTTVTIKVTGSPAIYVIDRGPGVSDEAKISAFTHHLRADRRGSIRQGLGVVRRIADAHGATVGIDDAPEGGAVFFMRFPNLGDAGQSE